MPPIRVLVVDDSVVIRRLVSDSLSQDPDIEVVGTASNGKIAIEKLNSLNPDCITLDIEMPEMDGLTALPLIRRINAKVPIIMFSTLTERGGKATLEALSKGATDYVTKPSNLGSVRAGQLAIASELIPKIKGLCHRPQAPAAQSTAEKRFGSTPAPAAPTAPVQNIARRSNRIAAIAIGVSTGGPNALATLVPAIPANIGVPIFVTQHMPAMFTKLLAERLDAASAIKVVEATDGMIVSPGTAYIAPGDFHMTAVRVGTDVRIKLNQDAPENSCRPAVDPMLRSLQAIYSTSCLTVILTGMGQDGLNGAKALSAAGGSVIAQDEQSSVVWGMPGFVAKAGICEAVLPLDAIAPEIVSRVGVPTARGVVR